MKIGFLLLFFLTCGILSAQADKAIQAYNNQNYEDAIASWNKECSKKNANTAIIYHNIGNSYFKLQNYSAALAYYEKSLRENYLQNDVKFNIKVARAKLNLDIENKTLFTNDWMRKIAYLIPMNVLKWLIIVLALFLLLMTIYLYFKEHKVLFIVKKSIFILCLLLVGIFVLQSFYKSETGNAIISEAITGYENASFKGKSKPLHEGEKVEIVDEIGQTIQVKTDIGGLYWIEKSSIYII